MSSSINPQNNRDLDQGILHLWSKFGGSSSNWWWVISRTSSKWGKFWIEVKFDLEGQGQSPPKTIGILTKVFYTYGPNLMILAWTGVELSRGQTWWRTDGRTDGRTQAMTIPGGHYWPRVKMASGMTKRWKSVIGSVCTYLMSCKAHYQYHEFGTLDA